MRRKKRPNLTTPDLVLLSLLAERPMHGYGANAELARRQIRDWAGVSRPQVYYSLEKLAGLGLIRARASQERPVGPDRRLFSTTAQGKAALADALEAPDWTSRRDRPAFLTWMALSWQAKPGAFQTQLRRRRQFLEHELTRKEATLRDVRDEVGHPSHEAVWMLTLTIAQVRCELRWIDQVASEAGRRAPARGKHGEEAD